MFFVILVDIYDLSASFFSEVVVRALVDFIGTFLAYDKKNVNTADRHFVRIKTLMDIRLSLKKGKKVKKTWR